MAMSRRSRDYLVAAVFLGVIGGLVLVGWVGREPAPPAGPAVALEMGSPAPTLNLPRLDGGTASLASLRGKVVLVNIWATWCPPCVREMPAIQRVWERYGRQGLEVLAVAVDDNPGAPGPDGRVEGVVSRFVDEYGLTFPVVLDPTGNTERSFGTEYLPTTVLIDRDGRIRHTEVGGRTWDEEPYVDMIETLLEES